MQTVNVVILIGTNGGKLKRFADTNTTYKLQAKIIVENAIKRQSDYSFEWAILFEAAARHYNFGGVILIWVRSFTWQPSNGSGSAAFIFKREHTIAMQPMPTSTFMANHLLGGIAGYPCKL